MSSQNFPLLKQSKFSEKLIQCTENQILQQTSLTDIDVSRNLIFASPQSCKSVKMSELQSSYRKLSDIYLEQEVYINLQSFRHQVDEQTYCCQEFNFIDETQLLNAIKIHRQFSKHSDVLLHVNTFETKGPTTLIVISKKFHYWHDEIKMQDIWKFILNVIQFFPHKNICQDELIAYNDGSLHLNFSPETYNQQNKKPILSILKQSALKFQYLEQFRDLAYILDYFEQKDQGAINQIETGDYYLCLIQQYLISKLLPAVLKEPKKQF